MSGAVSSPIPANWRVPLFYARFSPANANPGQAIQRSLIIAQCAPGITQPAVPQPIYSAQQAAGIFGAQSYAARMVAAYLANDPTGTLYVLALPAGVAATAATSTITATGTATAAGAVSLYIAGDVVLTPVIVGQTAAQLATAIAASVNALANCCMSATAAGAVVTLTAETLGAIANQIDVRLNYYGLANGEAVPAGLTLAVTAPSGGGVDPDLTGIDAIIGNQNFDFIAQPYTLAQQTTPMSAEMNNVSGRWSTTRQVYGGVFGARVDTDANLLSLGASLNDPHLTVMGIVGTPTPPWIVAAAYAGAAAASIRNLASQPLQNVPLVGVLAPSAATQLPPNAVNSLLNSGIATAKFGADGTASIVRAVSTYQLNGYGLPDQSYLDTETLFVLMAITRAMAEMFTSKYPRSILVDNTTKVGPGIPVITPNIALAEIYALYNQLEFQGLVDDAAAMQAATSVTLSATDPSRLEIVWTPNVVQGFRIADMLNQFTLLAAAA